MSRIMKYVAVASASVMVLAGCAANETSQPEPNETQPGEPAITLSGTINGSGASSMAAGQEAWIAAFQTANGEVTVNYDPTGSGTGRSQFIDGATQFAGSDSYWSTPELEGEFKTCVAGTKPWEFPVWISPIAVIFNLDGVSSLNLDADTIAGIFSGSITKWNDAKISSQNPGVNLPDLSITAVHRSDKSGTTGNFTDYMAKAAPSVWTAGTVEEWPAAYGGEGGQGTSGVVSAVTGGQGTIGYADASRAGSLGTVAVKVGNSYVSYSPEAAAAIVDASPQVQGRESYDLAFDVARDSTADGVYPVVLVSYLMGCNEYQNPAHATLVKAYASFLISKEGQDLVASAAGVAPITDALRQKAQAIIDAIK
jgi:phosphate transport system substrate-binding protein